MRIVNAKIGSPIHIGRQGENLATKVVFNIDDWIRDFGEGSINLVIQQNEIIYPQLIERSTVAYKTKDPKTGEEIETSVEYVDWIVTEENTQMAGKSQCELFYSVEKGLVQLTQKPNDWEDNWNNYFYKDGNKVLGEQAPDWDWEERDTDVPYYKKEFIKVKSVIYDIIVNSSIDASEATEAPDYAGSWVEEVLEAASSIDSRIDTIKEAEGWAVGTQDGDPVADDSKYYNNNAKYYAKQAGNSSTLAASSANLAQAWAEGTPENGKSAKAHAEEAADSVTDVNIIKSDIVGIQTDITGKHKEVVEKHGEVVSDATQVSEAWTNIKEVQVPHINEQIEKIDRLAVEVNQDAETAEKSANITANPPYMNQDSGNWMVYNGDAEKYEDTGIRYSLSITKSYPSVVNMEADLSNMREGDLVIIASNVGDEDNSKLYVHAGSAWKYLSDLSGLEGIGIASITKTNGTGQPGTKDTYTITLTDGRIATTIDVYQGKDGEGAGDMNIEDYDPTGAVYADGGIVNHVKKATKVTIRTWTAADMN